MIVSGRPSLNFDVGDVVRLLKDYLDDDLKAGDVGYVWCICEAMDHFEGDFYRKNGTSTCRTFSPDEVEPVDDVATATAHVPQNHLEFWQREAARNS